MQIDAFDAAGSALKTGVNLIEASAGTGKTFTIAMLVLRFVVEQNVDIKKLLVVTFTKAAAAELKTRIRQRLSAAKLAIDNQSCDDKVLRQWLEALQLDAQLARQRIDSALLDIDQAAIFTIHGFCQRALSEYALESGQLFDCELTGDIAEIRQNCADDFWRRQVYPRPLWQTALLTATYASPDKLLDSLHNVTLWQTVYPEPADMDAHFCQLRQLIDAAAAQAPELIKILQQAFADGKFKESYIYQFTITVDDICNWLLVPDGDFADISLLTYAGVSNGLHGSKFRRSRNQPSSEEQKQQYLQSLALDLSVFDKLHLAMTQLPVLFRRSLLEYLRQHLQLALNTLNVLSFDDLISRLATAISTADKGELLCQQLQQAYSIGLIDEFQDTDQLQWQIFSRIFATPEQALYLIGDPKQAIYKFRGADIFSYFAAQAQAEHRYTLLHNWRSHPQLVTGVNQLFVREQPFLFAQLSFSPVQAGRNAEAGGIDSAPPLRLRQLAASDSKQSYWTAGKAFIAIQQAVVAEILDLLQQATIYHADQPAQKLKPQHIAILLRTNQQALSYQQALQAVGIPAIINSKQSVFDTQEALEMHCVLQALAQPEQMRLLKQALSVRWFGLNGPALINLFNDETALDGWLSRWQDYHLQWRRHGLLAMLQQLFVDQQVELRLAALPQAERILTNLQHIAERLQQVSIDEHLEINKTLDWLQRAIQQIAEDSSEERQLRLESDAGAINIVTLHGAKGLEYPLVFCPNLWQRTSRVQQASDFVQCHEQGEIIADLGSEHYAQRQQQAILEELAEDLRLFYVAVTRAQYCCYLYWADVRTKERANDSAMAYLLDFDDTDDYQAQQQILQQLASDYADCIGYQQIDVDKDSGNSRYETNETPACLSYRQRQRQSFNRWQMSSYTALSAFSLDDAPELPEDKSLEHAGDNAEQNLNNDTLPKGAITGNVVHSLLEMLDFNTLTAGTEMRRWRNWALNRYGLNLDRPELLDDLLINVVNTPLQTNGFCLRQLSKQDCIKELPFYLSAPQLDTQRINRILNDVGSYQPLATKQIQGYLTGFIDLLCVYQGKYYLMDYKTNSLSDYQPESLQHAMREHNYGLQYWLYTLVADRYLCQRLPGYCYTEHFGGVMYLFVRGMQAKNPRHGVFYDLPAADKLAALAEVFFAED